MYHTVTLEQIPNELVHKRGSVGFRVLHRFLGARSLIFRGRRINGV